MKTNNFKDELKKKMDTYVHMVYKITKDFPREELYGVTSQFRRATLSIMLNYIEGYARKRPAVQLNFFEISYGSLQESKYLFDFSLKEDYLHKDHYNVGSSLADEIGAMLWTEIAALERSIKNK